MQAKPPAAGRGGEGNLSARPFIHYGSFIHYVLGNKGVSCFERNLHRLQIRGQEKVKVGDSSRIGAQSLRKTHLLLLTGAGQQS